MYRIVSAVIGVTLYWLAFRSGRHDLYTTVFDVLTVAIACSFAGSLIQHLKTTPRRRTLAYFAGLLVSCVVGLLVNCYAWRLCGDVLIVTYASPGDIDNNPKWIGNSSCAFALVLAVAATVSSADELLGSLSGLMGIVLGAIIGLVSNQSQFTKEEREAQRLEKERFGEFGEMLGDGVYLKFHSGSGERWWTYREGSHKLAFGDGRESDSQPLHVFSEEFTHWDFPGNQIELTDEDRQRIVSKLATSTQCTFIDKIVRPMQPPPTRWYFFMDVRPSRPELDRILELGSEAAGADYGENAAMYEYVGRVHGPMPNDVYVRIWFRDRIYPITYLMTSEAFMRLRYEESRYKAGRSGAVGECRESEGMYTIRFDDIVARAYMDRLNYEDPAGPKFMTLKEMMDRFAPVFLR